MVAFLALVAVAQIPARTFDLGAGTQAVIAKDPASAIGFGSTLTISRGNRKLAHLRIRELIEGWLKSDSFWGSHADANQFRYMDGPIPGANGRLQGTVYEVVPAPGGCLVRIGLINTSPSDIRVSQDIVLRWRSASPDSWPMIDRSDAGNSVYTETIKLPRYRGEQFLVSTQAIYRLSGPSMARKFIASLPRPLVQGTDWVGRKLLGSHLVLEGRDRWPNPTRYLEVDLSTGKLINPTPKTLKTAGITLPVRSPDEDLPSLWGYGPTGLANLPRPLMVSHTPADWANWVRIAGDKSMPDRARNVAFTELVGLVFPWGHGPWTADAIRAAGGAIRTGSKTVRIGAIRSVRAWVWNWPRQVRGWSGVEVVLVRQILADPTFRREVYEGATRERDQSGCEMGPLIPKPGAESPWDNLRVASYQRTLAISGSREALPFLKTRIPDHLDSNRAYLESLGFLPRRQAEPYVYRLAERCYHHKLDPNAGNDFEARVVFGTAVENLARMGVTRFDRFLRMTSDRNVDRRTRSAMLPALAYFADDNIRSALERAALNANEKTEFRVSAIFSFASCPGRSAYPELVQIERALPEGDLKKSAQMELKLWGRMHADGDRMRRLWGLER